MPTTPSGWYSTQALPGWLIHATCRRCGRIHRARFFTACPIAFCSGISSSRNVS